jgi:ferrochelatase
VNNHEQADSQKTGVLLINLGTPDAPYKFAVRPFLKELLSDPKVVGSPPPRWLWMLILNGLILNIRPKKSVMKYQSIWDTHGEGSPLLAISKKQKNAVKAALNEHSLDEFSVVLGMRYGNPKFI